MVKYIDGYVLPIAEKNLPAYKKIAKMAGEIWKKYGALEYFECIGDDLNPNTEGMKFIKFPQLAKARQGETVVFSFIVFKSKAQRDAVNSMVMKDPLMSSEMWKDKPMPFDEKRMAYGGFKAIVEFRNE